MALIGAVSSFAQTDIDPAGVFVFTDKDGNVYDDNATIECKDAGYDDFDNFQIPSGLYVKQTSDVANLGVQLEIRVNSISNGLLSVCFPQSCLTYPNPGNYDNGKNKITDAASYDENLGRADLMAEWQPSSETAYGQCSATFVLNTMKIEKSSDPFVLIPVYKLLGKSRTINVNFTLKDPTAINGVKDNDKAVIVARYSADGQLLNAPAKGVNILKMSDGSTVKVSVK